MSEYDVRADIEKNRFYLRLAGFFTTEETKKAADLAIEELGKLKPGFETISDISEFKPTTPEGAEEIGRAMKFGAKKGVGRVLRVVGPQVIGEMQFSRKSDEAGFDPKIVASIQEAEEMLDRGE